MKKALVTGITGQDGAYLAKLLLEKGYEVFGSFRRTAEFNSSKLHKLGIDSDIKYVSLELLEISNIIRTLEKIKPDEIYNLAAQSFVGISFEQPILTSDITALGTLRLLEGMRTIGGGSKFYQASSSEMFGKVQETPQKETTPFYPRSPYAVAKLFAHWATVNYRESYDYFACSGILFNHESPLRGHEFITRKITSSIAKIVRGSLDHIELGNLDSQRDWGYAAEYVDAMWRMLQQDKADDYVIATGECHSVREFAELAFECAGFKLVWEGKGVEEIGRDQKTGKTLIKISPEFFRPAEVDLLKGDFSKAKTKLGWEPKTKFKKLVELMTEEDLKEAKNA